MGRGQESSGSGRDPGIPDVARDGFFGGEEAPLPSAHSGLLQSWVGWTV